MKVNILTTGRFHVCDLARELSLQGHDVKLYSYVLNKRLKSFGLKKEYSKSFFYFCAPLLLIQRLLKNTRLNNKVNENIILYVDFLGSILMRRCNVFIGMSGIAVKSAIKMKKKYNAKILIERGSRHILSQKAILENMPGVENNYKPVSKFAVERETIGYEIADYVVIPSKHVQESFLEYGYSKEKLFRNPYGVDLKMFYIDNSIVTDLPTIIFVGLWSLRKGSDLLYKAFLQMSKVRLIHVGPVGDYLLPKNENFEHVDSVNQSELNRYYNQAHVFVLASREEGLALVQAQALAAGLFLVCTSRTGGEDLIELIGEKDLISVIPTDDVGSLINAIEVKLEQALKSNRNEIFSQINFSNLSWQAYGNRYNNFLQKLI
jgi:glycosyltransferase involved in cell wall biosynthesis